MQDEICGKRLIVLNTMPCSMLKVQGVPHAYLERLASLYHDQVGLVQGRQFPIKRGVEQGAVLSPLLFNAGLEYAMRKWKLRVQHCGLHCAEGELLTNVRYADELLLYAGSDIDLARMVETLVEELAAVGCRFTFEYFQDQNFGDTKLEGNQCSLILGVI